MDKLLKSDVNFQRVRDGRNALPFYFDLDLSTARSIAAGTHFIANVAGDSFYADANPVDGNCVVHFQDTNLDRAAVPFYVSPGFIANVPFTQLLIENAAQPGKKIRIAYGVDIDFQPGSVAQIAVSNSGGYTAVRPEAPTATSNASGTMAANTPITLVAPGANVNGLIVVGATFFENANAAAWAAALIAKNAAPTTVNDGDPIMGVGVTWATATVNGGFVDLKIPQFVPAGLGLYWIASAALGAGCTRTARWKAL